MENPFKKLGEEWKKASPKEKLFIVGAGASIIAVALYLHNKTSSSAIGGTGTTGLPSNLSPASSTGSPGATGSTGTTAPGSLLNTGSTDQGTFSYTPPFVNAPPPPYTPTTPATYSTPAATAGANVAQSVLSGQRTGPKNIVQGPSPSLPPTVKYAGPPPGYWNPTGVQRVPVLTYAGPPRTQPNILTNVYSSVQHSPAPAPARTFQAASAPSPVRRPRAF